VELVELGLKFGINFFEFGGFDNYDPQRLRKLDQRLRANAP
jgi:hypothetical protein